MLRQTLGLRINEGGLWRPVLSGGSTLALSLFFTSATVTSAGYVQDADGTGNTLTYSGASHKRQWNADGVLEYAPHNLLPRSTMAGAVAGTPGTAPTGWSIGSGGGLIVSTSLVDEDYVIRFSATSNREFIKYGGITVTSGLRYAAEIDVYDVSTTQQIQNTIAAAATTTAVLAGVASYVDGVLASGTDNAVAGTKVTIVFDCTTSGTIDFRVGVGCLSNQTADVTLTKPRLRLANSPDTYIATTSSAVYGPRVGTRNRKPVTNLLTYPEQFDNAAWTNSNTSESGSQSDPFGGTNAFKLIEADTAAGSTHYIEATTGITVYAKAYTHSVYAKAGERTWLRLGFATAAGVAFFNLSTGVVGTTSGLDAYGITAVDGAPGWYRCWITDTLAAGTDKPRITLAEADNDVAYDGDGASGLYIFGAMLNEGGIEDYIGATNLLTDDKAFGSWTDSGTTVVTADSTAAPDGTTTGDTITAPASGFATAYRYKAVSLTASQAYSGSIFLRAGTAGTSKVDVYDETGAATITSIDITWTSGVPSGTGLTVTYWGNSWYRCSFAATATNTGTHRVRYYPGTNSGSTTSIAWGAQITKGSTLYPYVGMPQTGFTKQGYLAEASATNLAIYSEGNLSTTNTTVVADYTIAPDGNLTADKVGNNASGPGSYHYVYSAISMTQNSTYCFSAFVKAESGSNWIYLFGETSTNAFAYFNISTGKVGTVASGLTAGIIPIKNGWYRVWISFTKTSASAVEQMAIGLTTADATQAWDSTGAANQEQISFWGVQVELGTYPSSYIKTSGGTASRSADAAYVSDSALALVNGTLVHDGTPVVPVTAATDRASLNDGTANEVVKIADDASANILFSVTDGGASQASIDTGVNAVRGVRRRVAGAFSTNAFAVSAGGNAAVTDASGTIPSLTRLDIGKGYHKAVDVYKVRKSNADLATLSTITDDGTSWRDEQSA